MHDWFVVPYFLFRILPFSLVQGLVSLLISPACAKKNSLAWFPYYYVKNNIADEISPVK